MDKLTNKNNNIAFRLFNQIDPTENKEIVESNKKTCEICYCEYDNVLTCESDHSFCYKCFELNMKVNLLDEKNQNDDKNRTKILKNNGYIMCPVPHCCKKFDPSFLIENKVDSKLIDLYYKTLNWVSHNKVTIKKTSNMLIKIANKFQDQNILREARRSQMIEALPDSKMCNFCNYGPLSKDGCDNLQTHGHQFLNSCPRCGDHQSNWKKLPRWDGRLPEETKGDFLLKNKNNKDITYKRIKNGLIVYIVKPIRGFLYVNISNNHKIVPIGYKDANLICYINVPINLQHEKGIPVYNSENYNTMTTKIVGFLKQNTLIVLGLFNFRLMKVSTHIGPFKNGKYSCCGCNDKSVKYCSFNVSENQRKINSRRCTKKNSSNIYSKVYVRNLHQRDYVSNFESFQISFNKDKPNDDIKKFIDKNGFSEENLPENVLRTLPPTNLEFTDSTRTPFYNKEILKLSENCTKFFKSSHYPDEGRVDNLKYLITIAHGKVIKIWQTLVPRNSILVPQKFIIDREGIFRIDESYNSFNATITSSKDKNNSWKDAAKYSQLTYTININNNWNDFVKKAKSKLNIEVKSAHVVYSNKDKNQYSCKFFLNEETYNKSFSRLNNKNYIIVCHIIKNAVIDDESERRRRLVEENRRRRRRQIEEERMRQLRERRRRDEERKRINDEVLRRVKEERKKIRKEEREKALKTIKEKVKKRKRLPSLTMIEPMSTRIRRSPSLTLIEPISIQAPLTQVINLTSDNEIDPNSFFNGIFD